MLFSLFKKKIKPFNSGWLSVGEGHKIHYMEVGNPCGQVVLKFHGGPGGCCRVGHAESFNLKKYRIVLFDQRGGGKSTFEDIVLKEPKFPSHSHKAGTDLIKALLQKNPNERPNFDQIKVHPFFRGFNWEKCLERKIKPNI